MKSMHVVLLIALGAGGGACRPPASAPSPFAPDGRLDVPGVIAVVRVNAPFEQADANIDWFVLDAERFGGRVAAVISGEGRERALARMQEEKLLEAVPGEVGAFRMNLPAIATPAGLMPLGGKEARAAEAIASSAASNTLRRFDRADTIALLPTVDLSEIAFSIEDAIRDADVAGQTFVVAIDGREVARLLDHDVMPKLRSASAMMQMLGHSGPGEDTLNALEAVRRLPVDLERWTIRVRMGEDRVDFESRMEAVANSPTAAVLAALRPITGEWPESELHIAFDPAALAAALEGEAAAIPGDASGAGEVQDFLASAARVLRETGVDRITETGAHLGAGVDPAVAARAIREFGARLFRLDPAFIADPPRFENGWLFFRDARSFTPATTATEDVLAITIPGDAGGRIAAQRIDRGIVIRGGGSVH